MKRILFYTAQTFILILVFGIAALSQGNPNDLSQAIPGGWNSPGTHPDFIVRNGTQLGRIFRDGTPAVCGNKVFPGTFSAGTTFNYSAFRFYNNSNGPVCITVNFDPNTGDPACNTNAHAHVYQEAGGNNPNPYEPSSMSTNFLADVGSSSTQPFDATVGPGNFEIVFTNTGAAAACNFSFSVTDLNGDISLPPPPCAAPEALCHDQVVNLDASGHAFIFPEDVDNGSTYDCGLQGMSVSQSSFDCGDAGQQTVTLTVTDSYGNSNHCTATVTVNPFVQITDVSSTDESCGGFGNGTVTITANAPGGTLFYSVDGGHTYQGSNYFYNLTPGTYNISVLAQGVGGCTASTATAIIGTGTPASVWYKDMDGDGYTDGVSQSSCVQPNGYVASAQPGDCNDNDGNQHPGQTWYEDRDGDGYGSGFVETACQRPLGCYMASELIAISGDCNDNLAVCYPGAPEICNGLDDDCDGQVDEDLGDLTYVGNVTFTNQGQLNAWSQCYTIIQGNLTIQNAGINSLAALSNIWQVTGNLTIKTTALTNLAGLSGLQTIGGNLLIQTNGQLTSLNGLGTLSAVGGSFKIFQNLKLSDCCPVHDLLNTAGAIAGPVTIYLNKTGCESVSAINNNCVNYGGNGSALIGFSEGNQSVNASELEMEIFPNPTKYGINVQVNGDFKRGFIRLHDMNGRLVETQQLVEGESRYHFDTSNGLKGVFLVQIWADGQELAHKVIVE